MKHKMTKSFFVVQLKILAKPLSNKSDFKPVHNTIRILLDVPLNPTMLVSIGFMMVNGEWGIGKIGLGYYICHAWKCQGKSGEQTYNNRFDAFKGNQRVTTDDSDALVIRQP
ncbi:hypothetical protein SADUNF_Sadunf16G0275100 [Salix dunnii]|uniref:Uncharacterized protein n=1 Tax=Salix dunnii TaxID=1413687 RepID=A0A835JEH5_9ROSI|nr:hypothetical protein SADUNF_Sadunf16G0275100 [Salix dunnii]